MSSVHAVFPARYDALVDICRMVQDAAEAVGFSEDERFRLQLACDEACTNIIEHAYGQEGAGHIGLTIETTPNQIAIEFKDDGRPFIPESIPEPKRPIVIQSDADLDDLKIGGLGLHFMRTIMDEVRFSFDAQQGNTLVMVKHKA